MSNPVFDPKINLMKNLYVKTQVFVLFVVILITNISANKTPLAGLQLNWDELQNSIQFQLSNGSNCIEDATQLQPLLQRFITEKYDAAAIENVFGQPDANVVSNQQFTKTYYLNPYKTDCKLKLVGDANSLTAFAIEGCE